MYLNSTRTHWKIEKKYFLEIQVQKHDEIDISMGLESSPIYIKK